MTHELDDLELQRPGHAQCRQEPPRELPKPAGKERQRGQKGLSEEVNSELSPEEKG